MLFRDRWYKGNVFGCTCRNARRKTLSLAGALFRALSLAGVLFIGFNFCWLRWNLTPVLEDHALGEELHQSVVNYSSPEPQKTKILETIDGFQRAALVRKICNSLPNPYTEEFPSFWIRLMHLLPSKNTLFCAVEKSGSTFWRRVLYQAIHPNFKKPFDVSIYRALTHPWIDLENNTSADFDPVFKYVFVRNPYSRILSAYIDKVFAPNPTFWDRFGKPAITNFRQGWKMPAGRHRQCYHDATFSEFVQFVIWSEKEKKNIDGHFLQASEVCVTCSMKYNFIGKMESFKKDALHIFQKFKLNSTIESMNTDLRDLMDKDAIQDSIDSPYSWREAVEPCMHWNEALQRVWRKLQIRGLIGLDQKYPLDAAHALNTTSRQMMQLALKARAASDPAKLKQQKAAIFKEMYFTVPLNVLKQMRTAYSKDFLLYDYDDTPAGIYDRSANFEFQNFYNFRKQDFTGY